MWVWLRAWARVRVGGGACVGVRVLAAWASARVSFWVLAWCVGVWVHVCAGVWAHGCVGVFFVVNFEFSFSFQF